MIILSFSLLSVHRKIYKFNAESITKLLAGLSGRKHNRKETTFLNRCLVVRSDISARLDKAIDHAAPHIKMRHLAPFEADHGLDLVATLQELACLVDAGFEVMSIDTAGKLNLFDLNDLLVASCFLFLFVALKAVFTVIHRAAYGRLGIRSHQNEIQATAVRIFQRRGRGHDPKLFPIRTNEANFLITNILVDL